MIAGSQRGRLGLHFQGRYGRTVLRERFASAPFGAVRANYPDVSGTPEVQITNPSGGILGRDHLEVEVAVRAGASASVPASGLCAVRVLADDAPTLYLALNSARDAARAFLGLTAPARAVW